MKIDLEWVSIGFYTLGLGWLLIGFYKSVTGVLILSLEPRLGTNILINHLIGFCILWIIGRGISKL